MRMSLLSKEIAARAFVWTTMTSTKRPHIYIEFDESIRSTSLFNKLREQSLAPLSVNHCTRWSAIDNEGGALGGAEEYYE